MIIERKWSMPNKHTFSIKPIKELIEEEITEGLWIDPYANESRIATITNDINPNFDTDYHLDALEFLKQFDSESVDGVLYDPPYSLTQVKQCYDGYGKEVAPENWKSTFYSNQRSELGRIVKKGGKVISFGWHSGGVGKKYGFEIERILLVPHGGIHNDTICTVERKVS